MFIMCYKGNLYKLFVGHWSICNLGKSINFWNLPKNFLVEGFPQHHPFYGFTYLAGFQPVYLDAIAAYLVSAMVKLISVSMEIWDIAP